MVPKEAEFEYTFSYWIFAWFLLYYFKFTNYNPKIWLIIAIIINIYNKIFGNYKINYLRIILLIIITFFIKILPLYLLRNTKYKFIDFIAGIVLILIFFLFMFFRLGSIQNIKKYFKNLDDAEKLNKPSTPLIAFIESHIIK
jgi:hypothetical protein